MQTKNIESAQQVINKLNDLVSFEQKVISLPIDRRPVVHLSEAGDSIRLLHGGVHASSRLNRPLIHQLGSRIWGNNQSYEAVAKQWIEAFKADKSGLEQAISALFDHHDLNMRYFQQGANHQQIYGFTSPQFVEVNPLDFRAAFIEQASHNSAIIPRSIGVEVNRFGNVVESFDFNSPGFQVGYKYGLVYARNTGYDAYKVTWGRWVLVCTNGMKRFEGTQSRWKHNHEMDLRSFIDQTVNDGLVNQLALEQQITTARSHALEQSQIQELFARMSLATATKERLNAQITADARLVGHNEWALSQAFTYLGSHDRHIARRTKNQFTEIGTDVVEHSLGEVLDKESTVGYDGYYGLLRPKPQSAAQRLSQKWEALV
ncbi:MAG: hypothetical protein HQL49_13900 [Gammaproteobacteria bacterium]|nr:hypothetical protein [Gammaproteobacteria bacterium]